MKTGNINCTFAKSIFAAMAAALGLMILAPAPTHATSQWARKYKVSCMTCHSAFPRPNYYGERFLRNGYQDPDDDNADGDKVGKKAINNMTYISKVSDWFGARLNMTPVQLKNDAIVVEGEDKAQVTMGNPNWLQFFVAGTISKNVSIFIENEFKHDSFHFSWYHLGFHNLASTYVNFQVGNISPREYGAYPNRLRIMGPVKGDVFGISSADGKGDEGGLNLSGYRPGIQYYGYKGPVLVWAGVGPGKKPADVNLDKHTWGGLRFEITENMDLPIEGSAISVWAYRGQDSKDIATDTARYNDFVRYSVEAEIRMGAFEVQAAYAAGEDDNWLLDAAGNGTTFQGVSVVSGYMINVKDMALIYPALQYDQIFSDDLPGKEAQKVTPSISYFPRENIRIGLYGRFDLSEKEKHDAQLNVRTMF